MLQELKNTPKIQELEPGHFRLALEVIQSEEELVQKYIAAKKTAEILSIRLVAKGLALDLNPKNEYFAKRIIVMELNI